MAHGFGQLFFECGCCGPIDLADGDAVPHEPCRLPSRAAKVPGAALEVLQSGTSGGNGHALWCLLESLIDRVLYVGQELPHAVAEVP